jgi:hypothetical protein
MHLGPDGQWMPAPDAERPERRAEGPAPQEAGAPQRSEGDPEYPRFEGGLRPKKDPFWD